MCQMHLLGMTQDCTLCVCICYPRNGSSKCGRSAGNPLAPGTECLCSDGVFQKCWRCTECKLYILKIFWYGMCTCDLLSRYVHTVAVVIVGDLQQTIVEQ